MNKDNLFLSISILISGILIAGAVIYSTTIPRSGNLANIGANGGNQEPPSKIVINPITAADHILGDPDAKVKIVEFSDLECPFCAAIHPTLKRIADEYDSKVAWVYRHYPLESIHSRAREAAIGSECAAELGGNDAFWKFVDMVFEDQEANLSNLSGVAAKIGLSKNKFESCLTSGKYDERIDRDIADAESSGGRGTPWSIAVTSDGETFPMSGALPYNQVKAIVEQALK